MPDIREDQHPKLWALLFSGNREKRLEAIDILTKIDIEWPVAWLALLLADPDSRVSSSAYQALRQKGSEVLSFLSVQRLSPQPKVRQMVVRLLGEFGRLEDLPEIIPALFDPFVDVREEGRKSIEMLIARALKESGAGKISSQEIEAALRLFASLSTVNQMNVRNVLVKAFLSLSVDHPALYWELISLVEPKARGAIEHEIVTNPAPRHIDLLYFGLAANDPKLTDRAVTLIERLLNKDTVSDHVSSLTRLSAKSHSTAVRQLSEKGLIGTFFEYFPWIARSLRIPFLQHFHMRLGEKYSRYLTTLLEEANPHIVPTLIDDFLTFSSSLPLQALRPLLENPSPVVRRAAIRYLYFRGKQEAVQFLIPLVSSDDPHTARSALKAVTRISRDYLIDHFSDLGDKQRRELTKMLQRTDEDFIGGITELLVGLGDEDRVQLTRILSDLAENPAAKQVLEQLMGDGNGKIRATAVKGLGALGLDDMSEEQVDRLLSDPDPRVRANAIESLPLEHKKKRKDKIDLASTSESPRERANAIVALFQLGDPVFEAHLKQMLMHPDSWMRTSGLWALSNLDAPDLLARAVELCSDPAAHVRKHAIRAIGKKGTRTLAERLSPWLSDPSSEVREAAHQALQDKLGMNYRA